MFQDSVTFDMRFMRGISNALFGGDGLFIAHLTGPGKVWLQTLTLPNLAHALAPYMGAEATQRQRASRRSRRRRRLGSQRPFRRK